MLPEKFIGSYSSLRYCEYTLALLRMMASIIHLRHFSRRKLIKKTMYSEGSKYCIVFWMKILSLPSLTFLDKGYVFSYCRITLNCSTVFLSILHAFTHSFLKSGLHATEWQSKSNFFRPDYFIWSKGESDTFFSGKPCEGISSFLCFGHESLECLAYDINHKRKINFFKVALWALWWAIASVDWPFSYDDSLV